MPSSLALLRAVILSVSAKNTINPELAVKTARLERSRYNPIAPKKKKIKVTFMLTCVLDSVMRSIHVETVLNATRSAALRIS